MYWIYHFIKINVIIYIFDKTIHNKLCIYKVYLTEFRHIWYVVADSSFWIIFLTLLNFAYRALKVTIYISQGGQLEYKMFY